MKHPRNNYVRDFLNPRMVLLLYSFLAVDCAASIDKQMVKKYHRIGDTKSVPDAIDVVSNGVVIWSRTLTNGYVLYDDRKSRLEKVILAYEPATLFMLRNGTNAIGFWGASACLPAKNSFYWADVIVRVLPVASGSRVSVAIHGRHFRPGLAWNFHTYGFDRQKEADLPACPQDEREILNQILSTIQRPEVFHLR